MVFTFGKSRPALAGTIVLVAALAATQALARPDTTRMSCDSARRMVTQSGAIVMDTGGHTFDRFVNHRGYCTPEETTHPAFVRSANDPQCFVGYTCEMVDPVDNDPN